jgi:hypothetical protein
MTLAKVIPIAENRSKRIRNAPHGSFSPNEIVAEVKALQLAVQPFPPTRVGVGIRDERVVFESDGVRHGCIKMMSRGKRELGTSNSSRVTGRCRSLPDLCSTRLSFSPLGHADERKSAKLAVLFAVARKWPRSPSACSSRPDHGRSINLMTAPLARAVRHIDVNISTACPPS